MDKGSVACCSPWGCKGSDNTEGLNWNEILQCLEQRPAGGKTIPPALLQLDLWGVSPHSSKLPLASPVCVVMVCSVLDRGFFRSVMSLSPLLCPEQITLQWKQCRYWRSARPQFSNPSCTSESPGGAFNTLSRPPSHANYIEISKDGFLTSVLYKPFPKWYHGEGNGTPLQYSCLENPMDQGAWWAAVHRGCQESDTTERLHFFFQVLTNIQLEIRTIAQHRPRLQIQLFLTY